MSRKLVEKTDRYTTYRNTDGTHSYICNTTGIGLLERDAVDDLTAMFGAWRADPEVQRQEAADWARGRLPLCTCSSCRPVDREGFVTWLAARVVEDITEDDIRWCRDCQFPEWADEVTYPDDYVSEVVCRSCADDYSACFGCNGLSRSLTTALNGYDYCPGCLDDNFRYCDQCRGYYDPEYDEHGHQCDCESPAQQFTLRNDGDAPLRNDTEVTVTLPAGEISAEGLAMIRHTVQAAAPRVTDWNDRATIEAANKWSELAWALEDGLGSKWQTRQGNYTRRLSSFAHKNYGLKMPPELMSQVGVVAREHSTAVDFRIDITRNLNLPPEAFAHEDSCWWGGYADSRCALKSNGGFGLRAFAEYGDVEGRAWVLPLRRVSPDSVTLKPTFDCGTADAFAVFNCYGTLRNYIAPRVLAHMVGMTYRKLYLTLSPMYVNNERGYLVAPEDLASAYTDGQLTLSLDTHSTLFETEQAQTVKELAHV